MPQVKQEPELAAGRQSAQPHVKQELELAAGRQCLRLWRRLQLVEPPPRPKTPQHRHETARGARAGPRYVQTGCRSNWWPCSPGPTENSPTSLTRGAGWGHARAERSGGASETRPIEGNPTAPGAATMEQRQGAAA